MEKSSKEQRGSKFWPSKLVFWHLLAIVNLNHNSPLHPQNDRRMTLNCQIWKFHNKKKKKNINQTCYLD